MSFSRNISVVIGFAIIAISTFISPILVDAAAVSLDSYYLLLVMQIICRMHALMDLSVMHMFYIVIHAYI